MRSALTRGSWLRGSLGGVACPGEAGFMSKLLRGGLAGLGAWKLGGGCLSTIIIFLILYWLLGYVF